MFCSFFRVNSRNAVFFAKLCIIIKECDVYFTVIGRMAERLCLLLTIG